MTQSKVQLRVYSHSERQTWRSCHARWGYAYAERLRPDRMLAWQRDGALYHRSVAITIDDVVDYLGDMARTAPATAAETARCFARDVVPAELEAMRVQARQSDNAEELLEELDATERWLTYAVRHYFECTRDDWQDYVLLGVELPFRVPIRDSMGRPISHVMHEGVIDLLMIHRPTNRVAVMDHKTLQTLGSADRRLQLEDQTTGYLYAARELWRAGRLPFALENAQLTEDSFTLVVHNLARKAAPSEPHVNKVKKGDSPENYERLRQLEIDTGRSQGCVSMAACDTTAEVFQRALTVQAERGIPIDSDQQARLEQIKGRGETFFKRVESSRTARDLERWCAEYVVDQRSMRDAEFDERLRTRNPGHCTGPASAACPYQVPCEIGQPAASRQGTVFGFVRVDDPHEEVRRGEAEWKERQERRRKGQRQGEAAGVAAPGSGEDRPGGASGDRSQAKEAEADHGRAEGEGERGEPPRSGVAAPHNRFF